MACCGNRELKDAGFWYKESHVPEGHWNGSILKGKRILSLSTVIAAPTGCSVLADLGAEVIKIETGKSGDVIRGLLHQAQGARKSNNIPCTLFEVVNRGQKSVLLDLKEESGRQSLLELVSTADAFITNAKKELLVEWGLDYDTLKLSHAQLVYFHFTGWGLDGPMADNIGYDVSAFNAALGMTKYFTTGAEMPRYPTGMGDVISGMAVASGTLLGLLQQSWTGKGMLVDLSLISSAAWVMASGLLFVKKGAKDNAVEVLDALYGGRSWGNKCFRTSDKQWLAFSCLDAAEQAKVPKALGLNNGSDVEKNVRASIESRSLKDNIALLTQSGIDWAGPATYYEEAVLSNETYKKLATPLLGMDDCKEITKIPVTFDCFDHKPILRAPPLGHHTKSAVIFPQSAPPSARTTTDLNSRNEPVRGFSHIRVVELGDSPAGAAGSIQLVDLGVEVVKVERKSGDAVRSVNLPGMFTHLNRGKKSVCVDFQSKSDVDKLKRLLGTADVLVVSLPKNELETLGLDWASLAQTCPKLIFVHVSPRGYGAGGWHGLGGEFLPGFAGGMGLFDCMRADARVPFEDDTNPALQLLPFWVDHAASHHVVLAVAGGLLHRQNSSRGQKVEVTIEGLSCALFAILAQAYWYSKVTDRVDFVDITTRFPYKETGLDTNFGRIHGGVLIPGLQAYECKDGLWIQLLELELFPPCGKIQEALGISVKSTAIYNAVFCIGPPLTRIIHYLMTFRDAFRERMKEFSRDEVMNMLEAGGVRCIRVGHMRDLQQHEQMNHLGLIQDDYVKVPVTLHGGVSGRGGNETPTLGQHNSEFLL